MSNERDIFYLNIDTQERVPVVWQVCLMVPAYMNGYVDVEATTQEEAAELALDKYWNDIEWDYDFEADYSGVQVCDVECENPPVGALLMNAGPSTGTNLDALFGRDDEPTAPEDPIQKANEGDRSCK